MRSPPSHQARRKQHNFLEQLRGKSGGYSYPRKGKRRWEKAHPVLLLQATAALKAPMLRNRSAPESDGRRPRSRA
uniref:Uncharacterized protein n=1 Tax=Oryza brachyantha TaxID=4533 RepID=J3LKR9_ORYBR